jgi:hypothetical protein
MALLTDARQAVIADLAAYSDWSTVVKRTYDWEDATPLMPDGALKMSYGDLPFCSIAPASGQSSWVSNQNQRIEYALAVELYTRWGDVKKGEELWEAFQRALWTGTNVPSVTHYPPNRISVAASAPAQLDAGPLVRQWTWGVVLWLPWNPRLAAEESSS